jgi:outer membrane biosynthesis protein TonB
MFSRKVFHISLLVSVVAHGALLLQNMHWDFSPSAKQEKLEIKYLKETKTLVQEPPRKPPLLKREPLLKLPPQIQLETKLRSLAEKEKIFGRPAKLSPGETNFTRPEFSRPDIISVKKKITLPPVDLDKIDSPTYVSYYQVVRERIKRAAYQNYSRLETGEVYLSFVVLPNGMVRELRLAEEKTAASHYLKEVAAKSVKDASPFPDFPKGLDYPQLSFNVIISFEIE